MSVWPAWKVREHCGTTSWFQVRLAFPDGARVDALAVLQNGCVSIEDVTAQPALSLADLTALANWIEGPLFASCGVAGERPYADDGGERPEERHEGERSEGPGWEERPEGECLEERPACEPPGQRYAPEACDLAARREGEQPEEPEERNDGERPERPYDTERPERPYGGERPEGRHEAEARGAAEIALGMGPRRARAGWPSGIEGRRLVAREYRAAQRGGVDPVLAVMTATGRSRRRSLRMIAQARDAGFLTPRHARRS
ncbi:hypothetical protein M878_39625 [Streptomyces roseochromogenus subsp. oscitans DS 12.976]|uniref:Uncharacterized protein n=1 Tax=Streptomyces roseochromogenus subsp. oscitans DS 12.976 TaxID=1352936 RepID=V6JMR0_STRRC|nr:hypothetical protein M878_39625 [Streptomyces roseochromogenus subsp. oscitans DS 12.976]